MIFPYIICMFTINIFLLMMQVPKDADKHDTIIHRMNDFGRLVVHALFVPLQGAYLITLYIYLFNILFTWELPSGGIVWLVTTMMVGMLFITTLIYPLLLQDDKPFDKKLVRWLAFLALPLLVLMTVGIGRRISDYGFTVARAYVLLFNIWCYVICFYLLFKQTKHIMWILISFALVFFIASIGPWNITASTRRILFNQVDDIFQRTGVELPLDHSRFDSLIQTMDKHEADILIGKLNYLKIELQSDSLITRWIDGPMGLIASPYPEGPSVLSNAVAVNPATFADMREEIMDIIYSQDTLRYTTRFSIPFRQLLEIAANESKQQPFTVENNDGALLIWSFDVVPTVLSKKDLHLEGLLFLSEAAFQKSPLNFEDEKNN